MIYVDAGVRGYALLATTRLLGPVRVAAGPAKFKSRVESGREGYTIRGTGAIVEAAAMYPERSRLFLELVLQQRVVGTHVAGPFTASVVWPDPINQPPILLPAFAQKLNHAYWSFGVGFRL
jgi:hypothetical protein